MRSAGGGAGGGPTEPGGWGLNDFSMLRAWGLGYRFVVARPLPYIALLIGLGLLVPGVLQYAAGVMTAPTPDGGDMSAIHTVIAVIVVVVASLMQTCAMFGVLRLGLGERERVGPALLFALLASLVVLGTAAVLVAFIAAAAAQGDSPALMPFVILAVVVPLFVGLATWATVLSALVGIAVVLSLALMMAVGAATGNVEMAATALGGSGLLVVMLLILGAVLVWLAARLSCTAAFMADHKRLNPIAAVRASWELTRDDQGRITLYIALLGLALTILLVAVLMVIGGGAAMMEGVTEPGTAEIGALVLMAILAAPFAFLAVLVPAGIYLHLAGERAPVDVFA